MEDRLDVIRGAEAARGAWPAWASLLDACPAGAQPRFFLEPLWLDAWMRHRAAGREVLLAMLRDGGQARAGLPLQIFRGGRLGPLGRRMSMLGQPDADALDLPARTDEDRARFAAALLRWWREETPGVPMLDLREWAEDGAAAASIRAAAAAQGLSVETLRTGRSPRVMRADGEAAGARPSRKLGQELRRRQRRADAAGGWQAAVRRARPAEVAAALARCAAIEAASWRAEAGLTQFRPERMAWLTELWQALAAEGRLVLAEGRLAGRLVAYHWGVDDHGLLLSMNLAHAEQASFVSPGHLLLHAMVERMGELGLDGIDASRGGLNHAHLLARYHGPVRMHQRLVVFAPGLRGRLARAAFRMGRSRWADALTVDHRARRGRARRG